MTLTDLLSELGPVIAIAGILLLLAVGFWLYSLSAKRKGG